MSPRLPVPIRTLATRLPDAGRIRIGIKVPTKNGKSRPEKIDRFRFTSQDRTALEQVAAIYGGHVSEWKEPKAAPGQWQVITDARELRIALPPDPLGNTPIYELWSGGGCQRRCDGETCEMLTQGQDGLDLQQVPCICDRNQALECNIHTRLSVLLPEVRFGGVWRLDTKGTNAAHELPGMVELIRSLQDKGIIRATMRVEWRRQVVAGQTREFAVPVLGVDASPNELAAGQARIGALGTGQTVPAAGELEAGKNTTAKGAGYDGSASGGDASETRASGSQSGAGDGAHSHDVGRTEPEPAPTNPDDEVVEAELVGDDDEPATADGERQGPVGRREPGPADRGVRAEDVTAAAAAAFADAAGEAPKDKRSLVHQRLRHAVIWATTNGRTASPEDCTPQELAGIYSRMQAVENGTVTFTHDALDDSGGVTFTAPSGERTVQWHDFEGTPREPGR